MWSCSSVVARPLAAPARWLLRLLGSVPYDWFTNSVYKWVVGYGRHPSRGLLLAALVFLVIFPLLYWSLDAISSAGQIAPSDGQMTVSGETESAMSRMKAEGLGEPSLLDAVYFSVVTATTLGYGDFTPDDTVGQLLAMSEAGLGLLGLGLLLWVVTRRIE